MRTAIPAIGVIVLTFAGACAPPPTPAPVATDPQPPVIGGFEVVAPRSEAPVTATLRWSIADPNGDELTCSIDLDGDGATDRTVDPCPTHGDLLTQYTTPGTVTPALTFSDATFPAVTAVAPRPIAVTAGPSEPFDITLLFDPAIAPEYRAAFESAARRWSEVIVDGWNPEPLNLPEGFLGWIPAFDGWADDVVIAASASPLDGPKGLLGRAGALGRRSSTGEPYFGVMQFDSDDLAPFAESGMLDDLILHEMGHILGVGLNWAFEGRIDDLLTDPSYNGAAAVAAWHELGGVGQVPVEDSGGPGTWGAHWRESTFDNELMTGYADGDERMSRVTIGALADRGYGVDLGQADPYSLPTSGGSDDAAAHGPMEAIDARTEVLRPVADEVLQGR